MSLYCSQIFSDWTFPTIFILFNPMYHYKRFNNTRIPLLRKVKLNCIYTFFLLIILFTLFYNYNNLNISSYLSIYIYIFTYLFFQYKPIIFFYILLYSLPLYYFLPLVFFKHIFINFYTISFITLSIWILANSLLKFHNHHPIKYVHPPFANFFQNPPFFKDSI